MNSLERYFKTERALNEGLIRLDRSLSQESLPVSDPVRKMETMAAFLHDMGNPERGIPAVHVTGTSGKGSVCAAAAGILAKVGFRVGLHVSPYLQVAMEKTWIDGQFVSADDFANAADVVLPVARRYLHPDTPASVHGMASVALTLELFRRAKVDVIVMEAGCGGRFDLSSFVETIVAVVTNVGLDHLRTLGPGIEQIARHKAGVARLGAPLITGTSGIALEIVRDEALRVGAPLQVIPRVGDAFSHNSALATAAALSAVEFFGKTIDDAAVNDGLSLIPMPGRSERMPITSPNVILDGAHNLDKLSAAVEAFFNKGVFGPKVCVFGALGSKVTPALAVPLVGRFDRIIVTEPSVYGKPSSSAKNTALMLKGIGCAVEIVSDPEQALSLAIDRAGPKGTVLATGSFYLIGGLRERFYSKKQIVLQRTSFPQKSADEFC
jgi:dihydrofolate synthase/folylpolyglutamate synthase